MAEKFLKKIITQNQDDLRIISALCSGAKIKQSENNLILLKNDTENIIEFVEYKNNKKTKKFSFWDLIYNNE